MTTKKERIKLIEDEIESVWASSLYSPEDKAKLQMKANKEIEKLR